MAKNQTLELSILIGGHVDNSLTQAVKSANTQLSSMANGASKLAANIAKVTVGIASGITAGLVDATKEAVAFESEMLDVTEVRWRSDGRERKGQNGRLCGNVERYS